VLNRSAKSGPTQSTAKLRVGQCTRADARSAWVFQRDPAQQAGSRAQGQDRLRSKAFDTLGLTANATSAEIKTRYKDLVKKHHPDANGGDRGSEDRFRAVIQAYQLLKQSGFC
jgi:DnaJ-domain-containing protein 1